MGTFGLMHSKTLELQIPLNPLGQQKWPSAPVKGECSHLLGNNAEASQSRQEIREEFSRAALPTGQYNPANFMVLEVSVVGKYALWNLW